MSQENEFSLKQLEPQNDDYITLSNYQNLVPLGRGARSFVYKAVKVIDKKDEKYDNSIQRLQKEIQIHMSLNHPNVVRMHQHFQDSDNQYLFLELCEGGDLFNYIKEKKKLSEDEIRSLSFQLAKGLKYLHDQNIIHRDLKLANLLLKENLKELKIADFGLAVKLSDDKPECDTLCGTPNYISPEIVNKQCYGKEIDCWSFGCIIYAMATGSPPFETNSAQETLKKVKFGQLDLPNTISNDLLDLLQNTVNRDKSLRLSIDQILNHKFYSSIAHQQTNLKSSHNYSRSKSSFEEKQLFISDQFQSKKPLRPQPQEQLQSMMNTPNSKYNIYQQQQQNQSNYISKMQPQNAQFSQQQQQSPNNQQFQSNQNHFYYQQSQFQQFQSQLQLNEQQSQDSDEDYGSKTHRGFSSQSSIFQNLTHQQQLQLAQQNNTRIVSYSGQVQTKLKRNSFIYDNSLPVFDLDQQIEVQQQQQSQFYVNNNNYSTNIPQQQQQQFDSKENDSSLLNTPLPSFSRSQSTNTFQNRENGNQPIQTQTNIKKNQFKQHFSNLSTNTNNNLENKNFQNNQKHTKFKQNLCTKGLKPAKYQTKNGQILISKDLEFELQINKGKTNFKVSSDGTKVYINKIGSSVIKTFQNHELPEKYQKIYEYAVQVCNTLKQKTPISKIENNYGTFQLMADKPTTYEANFINGYKIQHVVQSKQISIKTPNENQITVVNLEDDTTNLSVDLQIALKLSFNYLTECLSLIKNNNIKNI